MDRLHPALTVRLYTDKKCFGPGVAMLLRRVRTLRSLRAAAMDMDMAYSKAWSILRTAERELGRRRRGAYRGGPADAGRLRCLRSGAEGDRRPALPPIFPGVHFSGGGSRLLIFR